MKSILWAFLVLTISSCVTEKKCTRKFPPQIEVIIKDSIREVTIYRDTIIYLHLPADTILKTDTIIVKEGYLYIEPMYAETKLATASAWISYNKLNLLLTDKDTTIEVRLLNALKTSQFWEYKYKHEKEVVKEKYIPKFTKIMSKIGIALTLLIVAYIGFKMRNKLNIFK